MCQTSAVLKAAANVPAVDMVRWPISATFLSQARGARLLEPSCRALYNCHSSRTLCCSRSLSTAHYAAIPSNLTSLKHSPVAVLYQQVPPAEIDGIRKPKKPGGYSDSGADIAYVLSNNGVPIRSPVPHPNASRDFDWVFPDTALGIEHAIRAGAKLLWANTILFTDHPLRDACQHADVRIVGHVPELVQTFDDKWIANSLLKESNLTVANAVLVSDHPHVDGTLPLSSLTEATLLENGIQLPCVIKPVRGRGSQGVLRVDTIDILKQRVQHFLSERYHLNGTSLSKYGSKYIIEQYLSHEEITITVMPPGMYVIGGKVVEKDTHWSLPIVERFNHDMGIAPYSGVRAVVNNSRVYERHRMLDAESIRISNDCERAAAIVDARAPIRVDCRSDESGRFHIFDLNMKPNMTGASRPGREDQDSLTVLAARAIDWTYFDLLANVLRQAWKF